MTFRAFAERVAGKSFPQYADEFSTCGKRLWMNFLHGPESPKIGRNARKKIFSKKP
jgi:hypothetical protein